MTICLINNLREEDWSWLIQRFAPMVLCPVEGRNMVKRLGKGELLTTTAAKKQRNRRNQEYTPFKGIPQGTVYFLQAGLTSSHLVWIYQWTGPLMKLVLSWYNHLSKDIWEQSSYHVKTCHSWFADTFFYFVGVVCSLDILAIYLSSELFFKKRFLRVGGMTQ